MTEQSQMMGWCRVFTAEGRCSGMVYEIEIIGSLMEGKCTACGTVSAIPLHLMNPDVRRRTRIERAGIPATFSGKRFEETDQNRPALEAVRGWLANFTPEERAPALWGLAGRGKSHLLAAIAVRLINDCDQAVMLTSTRALLRDLQRFDNEAVRGETWERATTVAVLALDDLGAQQITDWRHDQISDLIEERYANGRPIVVATNWPPSQWPQVMDERTASRLRGMTFPVELRGDDRRTDQTPQEAPTR